MAKCLTHNQEYDVVKGEYCPYCGQPQFRPVICLEHTLDEDGICKKCGYRIYYNYKYPTTTAGTST